MSDAQKDFPTAVPAPETEVTPLTLTMVSNILNMSRESPRKRVIQRVHKGDDAGVHKMFNALQPGTYVPPHRHMDPAKTETVLVISGALLYVEFDKMGVMTKHTLVQPGTEIFGIDVLPHIYHTFVALKPDTLIFEVKDGPYDRETDKDIPDWAPAEGTPEAEPYLLNLIKLLADKANEAAEEAKAAEEAAQEAADEYEKES